MIQNDVAILQHQIEQWKKELPDYINRLTDKVISRLALPVRKVGANIMIDNVTHYDRVGAGAQIMAKGSVPKGSRVDATSVAFNIYQIIDGFLIHEKDIKLDPKLKSRELEIILNNIQRAENILAVNGNTLHNVTGITGAAALNSNGTATRTAVWTTPASAKYYDDILRSINLMDDDFEPRYLMGNRLDLNYLQTLSDDTKQPVWKQIAALFGKQETDPKSSWMIPVASSVIPVGEVYIIPHDNRAGEFVVSENPAIRQIAQQRGGNYPIEMHEWVTVEIHNNDAFVQLKVD